MESDPDAALRAAVSDVSRGRVTALNDITREQLDYDAFFAHRTLTRLRGGMDGDGARVPWSMIEKRTEGPASAARYLLDNGRREFDAYTSGLLTDLAPGIRTPRVHGTLLDPGGGITIWIEEIRHDGPRPLDASTILGAARDLGAMGGRWLGRRPAAPWLFTGWIDRHGQPEAIASGLATLRRARPVVIARLGDRLAAMEQLLLGQPRIRDILESLPHTLCHHDAVGANVFRADGQTVLIDWESVGPGPVGADLASLLFSSVRRGDASAGTMISTLEDALQSYADGLRGEAPQVEPDDVRRGFDAAIALRWKLAVDVVAGIESGNVWRRGSMPDEGPDAAFEELILLVEVLLDSAGRTLG